MLAGYGELKRMYVDPAQRGVGVGAAASLQNLLEHEAAQCGCPVLRLETGIHQQRAIAFYAGAGYARHTSATATTRSIRSESTWRNGLVGADIEQR